MQKQRQDGFTLVEILVVITIIAVLVAVLVPQYHSFLMRSCNSKAAADLRNLKSGFESFKADFDGYPTDLAFQ